MATTLVSGPGQIQEPGAVFRSLTQVAETHVLGPSPPPAKVNYKELDWQVRSWNSNQCSVLGYQLNPLYHNASATFFMFLLSHNLFHTCSILKINLYVFLEHLVDFSPFVELESDEQHMRKK